MAEPPKGSQVAAEDKPSTAAPSSAVAEGAAANGGSNMPLVIGAVVGLLLLGGVVAFVALSGKTDELDPDVSEKKTPIVPKDDLDPSSSADVKSPWRSFDYKKLDVPSSVSTGAKQVKPTEATVIVDGLTVFYREVNPEGAFPELSVFMLHGAAFKSETWLTLGTLGTIGLMGYRVVAIDMPGFGNSPSGNIPDQAAFVQHILAALHLERPVIVSPSLSGQLSLPFLVKHWQLMAGYVPVAPVGWNVLQKVQCDSGEAPVDKSAVYPPLQPHLPQQVPDLSCIKVPTLVVFGEFDRSTSSAVLQLLPKSVAVEIPQGSHPAYLDNPDLWHQALYNFLLRVSQELKEGPAAAGGS